MKSTKNSVKWQEKTIPDELDVITVTPGQLLTDEPGFMRGHGTLMDGENLYASIAGIVERVDKLISVKSLAGRYVGEIGDVVVGRIVELAQKKWRVDINGRQDATLHLSSVNLPGGILRRKLESDELNMRRYFKEGDVVSAEVQSIHADGSVSLHTRSLKYGKLKDGTFLKVSSALIKRTKSHFITLPCGVDVILGLNGYIWVGRALSRHSATSTLYDVSAEIAMQSIQEHDISSLEVTEAEARDLERASFVHSDAGIVTPVIRDNIARVSNAILALSNNFNYIYDASILNTYEASLSHSTYEMTRKDVMQSIITESRQEILASYR